MKILFLGICFLGAMGSTEAFAFPKLGDAVEYQGVMNQRKFRETLEFIEESAGKDKLLLEKKVWWENDSQPKVQRLWLQSAVLYGDAQLQQIVDQCKDLSGTPVTIAVVAGTFKGCRLNAGRKLFRTVGVVPFQTLREEGPRSDDVYELTKIGH